MKKWINLGNIITIILIIISYLIGLNTSKKVTDFYKTNYYKICDELIKTKEYCNKYHYELYYYGENGLEVEPKSEKK